MTKVGVVFPGQGSQANLMGSSFEANKTYQEVQKIAYQLNSDLESIIKSETDERINQTEYSQLAICANQLGIWQVIKEKYDVSDYALAGFSLGEYSALTLAADLDVNVALNLVDKRAKQMAKLNGVGTMKAVIGLTYSELSELLEKLNHKYGTTISIANYNLEKQIVIAGAKADFIKIDEELSENARRVVELKVSGAFHTEIFNDVAKDYVKEINSELPLEIVKPMYSNVSADVIKEIDGDYLIKHMVTGVNWYNEVNKMLADGIDTFIEIGEKSVLIPMIKKINRKVKTIHISNEEEMEMLEEVWTSK